MLGTDGAVKGGGPHERAATKDEMPSCFEGIPMRCNDGMRRTGVCECSRACVPVCLLASVRAWMNSEHDHVEIIGNSCAVCNPSCIGKSYEVIG